MKKITFLISILLVSISLFGVKKEFKNVILMIPDGMSQGGVTLTRWCNGGQPLTLDELACGVVRTYCATAPITDSAPAATAMATGFKSGSGFISVLPDQYEMPGLSKIDSADARKPIATVLEAAKLKNKATGLVSTCEVMHATPASFASHDANRGNYDFLSEQMIYNNIDVVFGGGYDFFTSEVRRDKDDLITQIKGLGYQLIRTPQEMNALKETKVFGLFTPYAMSNDIDRDPQKEPSLSEMTDKAIKLLNKDKDGFFLMVEGSKIDWAAHTNEPVGMVSEIRAFDRAVKVALDFAKTDGNTAIIICSDHGNSGITIGNRTTDYETKLAVYTTPITKAIRTGEVIESYLNAERSNVKEVMSKYYGIDDLNDTTEVPLIVKAQEGRLTTVIGAMIAKRAELGFTSGGHTGEDLVLYSYTPDNQLRGTLENTDIAKQIAKWLGLDMKTANNRLFRDAKKEFLAKGAVVFTDESDKANPVLVVKKNGKEVKFPVNKNYGLIDSKKNELGGVVVFSNNRWFVPASAIDLLK